MPAAIKLFRVQAVGSFSGVYSQKCINRISKNARLWAYAADVENLSFQQYPYFSNKAYLPSKQPIFVENMLFVENYVERLLKSLKNRWKNGKICGSSFLNYSFH